MGRGTDAAVELALVECWAKDGVSETAVGRSSGQALCTGEDGGWYMGSDAADETRSQARRKRGEVQSLVAACTVITRCWAWE